MEIIQSNQSIGHFSQLSHEFDMTGSSHVGQMSHVSQRSQMSHQIRRFIRIWPVTTELSLFRPISLLSPFSQLSHEYNMTGSSHISQIS